MSYSNLSEKVIAAGLCARCGICAGVCPVTAIGLDDRNLPVLQGECTECGLCGRCCPGADVDLPLLSRRLFDCRYDPADPKGYVESLYVVHAADETIRNSATSGGAVTALLIHLLQSGEIDGAVVARPDADRPHVMRGFLATTAQEIADSAQSKYCLTASMDVLGSLRRRRGKFAVVGLPCQIQGLRKVQLEDPSLAGKIYGLFGLCCHCNMEPYAHLEAMQACNINPSDIKRFEFRGGGWPGGFRVIRRNDESMPLHRTRYATVLNVMFKLYGAKRCFLCIDALAEMADLSFGDFWANDYRGEFSRMERCTLVYQRTDRGKEILRHARRQDALVIRELPPERMSKRILNMAAGKKRRSMAGIAVREKRGFSVPDYHCTPTCEPGRIRKNLIQQRVFDLFRKPRMRMLVLKILFSPAGLLFERLNTFRKNRFFHFHDN